MVPDDDRAVDIASTQGELITTAVVAEEHKVTKWPIEFREGERFPELRVGFGHLIGRPDEVCPVAIRKSIELGEEPAKAGRERFPK